MFPQFNQEHFAELPAPALDLADAEQKATHDELSRLVEKRLELTAKLYAAASQTARLALQEQLDATDRQIDQLVYQLYGLTAAEIALVEGSQR